MRFATLALAILSALIAIVVAIIAFLNRGSQGDAWAVVAACLSVLVAAISAWSSYRTAELAAAEVAPYVAVALEIVDVAGGKHLRIWNTGKTSAVDVVIQWEQPAGAQLGSYKATQLRPTDPMAWPLPDAFRSAETYRALVSWRDWANRPYQYTYEISHPDLMAHGFAAARPRHDGDRNFVQLKREIAGLRSDLSGLHGKIASAIKSAIRLR